MDIPGNHVQAFKDLFEAVDDMGKYVIIDEDREAIWCYFDSLVKICIKFVHKERCPQLKDLNGKGIQPVYTKNVFPKIRLQHFANMWKVDLSWPKVDNMKK